MRICLVTNKALPDLYEDEQPMKNELLRRKHDLAIIDWRDPKANWADFDLVIIRNPWDYVEHVLEFKAWIDACEDEGARLANPARVLRANLDKRYLLTLAVKKIPIVPTKVFLKGTIVSLETVCREVGWEEIVVKPLISAGAHDTHRLRRGSDPVLFAELLKKQDMMVQPFLTSIATEGEWSLLYFGGKFSHAVQKVPKAGDFRVQHALGGTIAAKTSPAEARALADKVIAACGDDLLYARIDLVRYKDAWCLGEAELLEPMLYFGWDQGAAARFADAVEAYSR